MPAPLLAPLATKDAQEGSRSDSPRDERDQSEDADESQRLVADHDSPPSTLAVLAPELSVSQVQRALTSACCSAIE